MNNYEIEWYDKDGYHKTSVCARNEQDAQMRLNLIRNDVVIVSLVNCDR